MLFGFLVYYESMVQSIKSGPSKVCGRQPLKNLLSPLLSTLTYS